jgi:long-subunit acyl-CoA synthetase (AMP-forming)
LEQKIIEKIICAVAIIGGNSPEWVISDLAAIFAG